MKLVVLLTDRIADHGHNALRLHRLSQLAAKVPLGTTSVNIIRSSLMLSTLHCIYVHVHVLIFTFDNTRRVSSTYSYVHLQDK